MLSFYSPPLWFIVGGSRHGHFLETVATTEAPLPALQVAALTVLKMAFRGQRDPSGTYTFSSRPKPVENRPKYREPPAEQ